MKPFVFVAFFLTLILGSYWGYREWMGPSDETAVSTESTDPSEAALGNGEARDPSSAGQVLAAPTAGALAPGQVPGPRDGSAPSGSTSSSSTADPVDIGQQELNSAGFPKAENTRPDGRLDLGDDDPSASNHNADPFQPQGQIAPGDLNAFSDLPPPPPPPPRVAEEGAGEPVDAYDGGAGSEAY